MHFCLITLTSPLSRFTFQFLIATNSYRQFKLSIFNPEIVKQSLIVILRGEASIEQITANVVPLLQATIIEVFQFIGNYERHKATGQALLEHNQTPHSAITILERMYSLKALMKINYILKRLFLY